MKQFFALSLLAIFAVVAAVVTPAQETIPLPAAEVVRVHASDDDPVVEPFTVQPALVNVGKFVEVDGLLLLSEAAKPELANVGVLRLPGKFDAATIIAENEQRKQVPTKKVSEREWLILGAGQVIVYATLGTKEPFTLTTQRYDVFVPSLKPDKPDEPDDPDKPVDPDKPPTVPEDRFENLGQRVSAMAGSLTLKKEVAANYRQFAEQLKGSIDTVEISRAMVAKRDSILKDVKSEWMPVLTLVLNDFTKRRPEMVRADVVDHWLAIANGLDPVK